MLKVKIQSRDEYSNQDFLSNDFSRFLNKIAKNIA